MPGEVEVPESVEAFPARICECGAVHDRPEAGCPECGSVIARRAGLAIFVADLNSIRSQERQRVVAIAVKEFEERAAGCQEVGQPPEPFVFAVDFLHGLVDGDA